GPPPIRSPRAVADHHRMTSSPRRSSAHGAACGTGSGPGTNASPLGNEPAAREAQHDRGPGSRVGWTSRPLTPDATHFAGNTRSGRGHAAGSHALVESES